MGRPTLSLAPGRRATGSVSLQKEQMFVDLRSAPCPSGRPPDSRAVHETGPSRGSGIAASTVWQILKDSGIDPAPQRSSTTWAMFLRSQAEAIAACDFVETISLTGQRLYARTQHRSQKPPTSSA
jgi:hypothetical protein